LRAREVIIPKIIMASAPLQQLLFLLLLLLPSPGGEHLSGNNHAGVNDFHPIFLVPGMSCSNLAARLTEAYRPSAPHCSAMKGKGWFGLWNNVSDLAGDCWGLVPHHI
jgi:lysophospholipase-3